MGKNISIAIIFILITVNFILFYIDSKNIDSDPDPAGYLIAEADSTVYNEFEKIDIALLRKNFDRKWINTKKTDSLWFKYIKVPDIHSLSRYNYFMQKMFRDNEIPVAKVTEYELSNKLIFNFTVEGGLPAVLELRVVKGLESENVRMGGNVSLIVNSLGDNWGQEWIRKIIEADIPLAVGIFPGRWATGVIAKEAAGKGKDVLVCLPMEPDKGNIDKEKLKIMKGMNEFTIEVVLDKILKEIPGSKGVISYKGSRVISDYSTMDALLKKLKTKNLFYIESESLSGSYRALLSAQYDIPSAVPDAYYIPSDPVEQEFAELLRDILGGKDLLIIMDANEKNFNHIYESIIGEKDISILSLSQFLSLKR